LAILLTLGLSLPSFAQSQPQVDLTQKNVLILHTLEGSTPLSLETNRGLLDTLRIGGIPGANLFFESMDLRRNPGPELRKLLVEQMRLKWSHRKADMIITVYPEALEFVLNDCRDVFPHVPIIALHLPQNFMMAETGRRIIGHFPTYDITGTIDNALKLVPGTKRVYVVSGAHKVDKWLEDQARLASKKWERVEFLYLSHMTIEDILATVSKAPPGSVILYLALTQDVAGKSHTGLGLAHELSQVSTVPVFGLFESALGYGVTGGTLISWDLIGKRAGQLVIDILKGVKTLDEVPPVLDVPSVPMFDWRQFRRWNLSEAALPKGSIVINRELTFWDFKYYIVGGLAFVLLETALIIFLIVQRRRKKSAEEELKQKTEELNQFFNVTLDLLCIATTDGYFVRLNPAVERVLGYTREELMARQLFEFIHPDDVERTRKAVAVLGSQQNLSSFENRYRCKDGTYRWLEWSSAPSGNLIYAAARDVTERKLAEQALEERLMFETLLAEISAHFVNLPADRIDSQIEYAQRRICELLDLDRSTLWEVCEGGPRALLLTQLHQPQGSLPPVEQLNAMDSFPWTAQKVLDGETLIISKMTDLPPEAGRDRENFCAYGTKSDVLVPLSVGEGPVFGMLAFAVMREERSWPETVVTGFKLIAQVFANALARKRAEETLEERLRFERLVSDISARFVNIPPDRVDSEIERGLREILEFFKVDRCMLIRTLHDHTAWQVTHVAYADDQCPRVPVGAVLSRAIHPWAYEMLIEKKQVLAILNTADAGPPEAHADRQTWIEWGTRSTLLIPIHVGESGDYVISINLVKSERFWPEEFIPRVRLLGEIFVNALERRHMNKEIQNAAEEWQTTFDSVQDLVMTLDREFKVVRVNAAALSFLNLPLENIMGKHCYDLMHGANKPFGTCPLTKMLETKTHEESELYDETRGTWLHVSADPIFDDKGEIVRIVHTAKDVTEHKRAEQEALDARRELTRMERLSRMGELSASLSHELNQPLTAILSNARAALRFLQSGKLDLAELEEILQDIVKDDKRAGDIIRNLRAMVKPEEGEQELTSINDVLHETVALFRSEAIIRNVRIETDLADALPPLHINKVQIQQVLINLLTNAAESMAQDESADRVIVLRTAASGEGVVKVAVRDFGSGIEEQELHKIFEPFFTTKRSGLGMGLSLSRSIIESHGGHIWAENNPDKGITFYFDLPTITDK
jgi:PAS domain S-box-containing protein